MKEKRGEGKGDDCLLAIVFEAFQKIFGNKETLKAKHLAKL